MQAELKDIVSTKISCPFDEFRPEDHDNFGISVQLMVGPKGEDSSDSFDLPICSPEWLKQEYISDGYIWGRNMLIVLEYNRVLIKRAIERYVSRCSGNDWPEIAQKLSKIAGWEFEDYQTPRD